VLTETYRKDPHKILPRFLKDNDKEAMLSVVPTAADSDSKGDLSHT